MDGDLDDRKRELSRQYLGMHGIHSVGVRREEDAICIYMNDSGDEIGRQRMLNDIREAAKPHKVIIVRSDSAGIH